MPDVGLIGDRWGGMKRNGSEDRVENKRKEAEGKGKVCVVCVCVYLCVHNYSN